MCARHSLWEAKFDNSSDKLPFRLSSVGWSCRACTLFGSQWVMTERKLTQATEEKDYDKCGILILFLLSGSATFIAVVATPDLTNWSTAVFPNLERVANARKEASTILVNSLESLQDETLSLSNNITILLIVEALSNSYIKSTSHNSSLGYYGCSRKELESGQAVL